MGNRAVITTNANLEEVGIYLHWNGGRDSIEGFLAYCNLKGYRTPSRDSYGWAYLAGVISNFFGDGLCCGVDIAKNLDCDNYNNGVFIIDGWKIVGRKFNRGGEQLEHDLHKMIEDIDESQPEKMRLTEEEWKRFEEVKAEIIAARG